LSDRCLSEEQARQLWERAAEIQAEAARREEAAEAENQGTEGKKGQQLLEAGEDEEVVCSLASIRQAGMEAGIQPDFLDLAYARLIGGGTVGSQRLVRMGSIKMYRWGIRSLE
jgi:hypothetical protein